ncbi:hypothetical protein VCHENC02_1629A, partial [Vibrio harveyi]
MVRGH